MKIYDYIITGAGLSGLMLAYRMSQDAFFEDKSILIIDKTKNQTNNRTWCFWEQDDGEWNNLLHKSWPKIFFGSPGFSEKIDIAPYCYKMLRSARLYDYFWQHIEQCNNMCFTSEEVSELITDDHEVEVITSHNRYKAKKVFNSILLNRTWKHQKRYPVLKQHFVGWFIKTKTPMFDDEVATFMDFDIPQNQATRFMYILPTSKHEALFEYTLFSENLLKEEIYDAAISKYLKEKNITDYEIVEKEKGAIPMSCYQFWEANTKNVVHIGTAGGWTKASTGYTFKNTSKKTVELINFLKTTSDFRSFTKRSKFWFYDLLLLDVLSKHNDDGHRLFSSLFKKTPVTTIFKFLDEESSYLEDLKIITAVPPGRFVKALLKRLF